MRDPRLKTLRAESLRHLGLAGNALAVRQAARGPLRGNVPPWPKAEDADFHGTLAAVWIWSRSQTLAQHERFAANIAAAWAFVEASWTRFVPEAIGPDTGEEAAYDCALALRAFLADREAVTDGKRSPMVDGAARVLAAYLADLDDLSGREFRDPGWMAWNLGEYARAVEDRGLLSSARKFVDRAFGMKAPPAFAKEPALDDGLFDFSSTSATRIMAILATEGTTPFIGAWLRERVGPVAPRALINRPRDESTWNACVAWALGNAHVVSTDPQFLDGYAAIVHELGRRDRDGDGAIGRGAGFPEAETLPTFYYALAVDSLAGASAGPAAT